MVSIHFQFVVMPADNSLKNLKSQDYLDTIRNLKTHQPSKYFGKNELELLSRKFHLKT